MDEQIGQLDRAGAAHWNRLTLPHLFERHDLQLGKTAIVFEDRTRTYGELRDAGRRVANALIGLGVEEFDRVAVLSSNRLEFIEIETGIAAARAIMVPLNWRLRPNELANLLRRSAARAILVEDRFLGTVLELRRSGEVPDLRSVISLDGGAADLSYDEIFSSSSPERPTRIRRMDDPHEIIFTSGTTGQPKGVVWTDGTVIWNSLQQLIDFRLGPEHSTYAIIDLYYIGGRHAFTWAMLHQGGTVHVKRSSGFDAEEVLSYVERHGVTHVLWVPTMLYDILRLPNLADHDTSRLEMIMCGGQPVSVATTVRAREAFPQTDFVQVYGLTEGGAAVTFIRPEDARTRPGSAGRPASHVELKLIDANGAEVPAGTNGEILIRAPSLTAGYWDDPETTGRQIVDGWLHTGDMGHVDADGFLYIVGPQGRHDHQRRDERVPVGDRERAARASGGRRRRRHRPAARPLGRDRLRRDRAVPGRRRRRGRGHRLLHGADRRLQEAVHGAGRRLAPAHGRRQAAQVRAAGALRRSAGRHSARGLSDRTVGVRRREKQHHQGVEPTVGRGER